MNKVINDAVKIIDVIADLNRHDVARNLSEEDDNFVSFFSTTDGIVIKDYFGNTFDFGHLKVKFFLVVVKVEGNLQLAVTDTRNDIMAILRGASRIEFSPDVIEKMEIEIESL